MFDGFFRLVYLSCSIVRLLQPILIVSSMGSILHRVLLCSRRHLVCRRTATMWILTRHEIPYLLRDWRWLPLFSYINGCGCGYGKITVLHCGGWRFTIWAIGFPDMILVRPWQLRGGAADLLVITFQDCWRLTVVVSNGVLKVSWIMVPKVDSIGPGLLF